MAIAAPAVEPSRDSLRDRDLVYTAEERALFQIMTGFFRSKLLATGIELDLFTWLADQSRSAADLERYLQLRPRPTRVFLDALVNVGLLRREQGRYLNSGMARKYLVRGKVQYVGDNVTLFDSLYASCADFTGLLRSDKPTNGTYTYFFDKSSPEVSAYSEHMHGSSIVPALALAQFHDFSDCKRVLDVGGGYGRTCMTLVSQYPQLETVLFDLPQVCDKARENLADFWLADRIQVHAGDFFKDPFPSGMDAILLMRITHDWSVEEVRQILRKAYDALPSGGRLILYETFKSGEQTSPGDSAIVSLLLLAISPAGECRTFDEIRALLMEAGFADVRFQPTIFIYSIAVATKA